MWGTRIYLVCQFDFTGQKHVEIAFGDKGDADSYVINANAKRNANMKIEEEVYQGTEYWVESVMLKERSR